MARLFGRMYTRPELLARVGDISQVAGARPGVLRDGRAQGLEVIQLYNGSGLEFDVLAGRSMDLGQARYRGIPLAWRSPVGDVAASYYEPAGLGWLRSFGGGLLVSCGLTFFGAPEHDREEDLGLHGRVGNLPAQEVSVRTDWEGDDYVLAVSGRVRQAAVWGENLELRRTITTRLGEPAILVEDTVTNLGYRPEEHMFLYHINLGFPIVDDGSELIAFPRAAVAKNEAGRKGLAAFDRMTAPAAGFAEELYYLDPQAGPGGLAEVAVVNRKLGEGGLGVRLRYSKATLPYFVEWKMLGQGLYVLGIEPGNAWEEGRAFERRRGTLQVLQPGESRSYRVELSVLDGPEAVTSVTDHGEGSR